MKIKRVLQRVCRKRKHKISMMVTSGRRMRERRAKRRKRELPRKVYIDCDFILGSFSEVDNLFSIAKNVLTVNRRSMAPHLFEALIFIKLKELFWDFEW